MKYSSSWESYIYLPGQEIPKLLGILEVYYCAYQS